MIEFLFYYRFGVKLTFCLVTMESTMTEFEENVSFDIDDPDFAPSNTTIAHNILRGVQFTDITFGVNKCEYIYVIITIYLYYLY